MTEEANFRNGLQRDMKVASVPYWNWNNYQKLHPCTLECMNFNSELKFEWYFN